MADNNTNVQYRGKVLIIDDVEVNRFVLRNIISEMGYQPILAENGVQGLKVLQKCEPELILLDISMPEMGGYEFASIVKSNTMYGLTVYDYIVLDASTVSDDEILYE